MCLRVFLKGLPAAVHLPRGHSITANHLPTPLHNSIVNPAPGFEAPYELKGPFLQGSSPRIVQLLGVPDEAACAALSRSLVQASQGGRCGCVGGRHSCTSPCCQAAAEVVAGAGANSSVAGERLNALVQSGAGKVREIRCTRGCNQSALLTLFLNALFNGTDRQPSVKHGLRCDLMKMV